MKHALKLLQSAAQAIAGAGFAALAIRFLVVAGLQADSPAAFLVLVGGGAAAAAWNPLAAFRAFALLYPLLFGLARMNLLAFSSADAAVFAGLSLAAMARGMFMPPGRGRAPAGHDEAPRLNRSLLLAADLLAAWTVVSLAAWMRGRAGDPGVLKALGSQPTFGFSDPLFPLTDTLIWLLGWRFLRHLILEAGRQPTQVDAAGDPAERPGMQGAWLCLCLLSWALFTLAFFYVQAGLGLIDGFNYDRTFSVPTSMFNDSHTFGGVSAALAVALIAWSGGRRARARVAGLLLAAVLLVFVAVCYSRAAWLAAAAGVGLYLAFRHRRTALVLGALVALGLGGIAWRADDILRLNRPYLTRIVYSVRLDRLSEHNEARFATYRRIPAMIAARPLVGHGPGSSRVTSLPFVAVTDRTGPDFIHNAVLQAAVEQGVPAAALLCVLLFLPLFAAARRWHSALRDPASEAACLALATFLLTQLTSNSLNIYLDQQVFLWTVTGLLVCRFGVQHESGEQALVTGQARVQG